MACQQGLHVRHVLYHFCGRWLCALQSILIVLYCRILEGRVPCSLQPSCRCQEGALHSTEQHNVSGTGHSASNSCCNLTYVTARLLVLLQHTALCLQRKHRLDQASGPTKCLACFLCWERAPLRHWQGQVSRELLQQSARKCSWSSTTASEGKSWR